jgi:hypothetical protein
MDDRIYDETSYNKGILDSRNGIFNEHIRLAKLKSGKRPVDKYDVGQAKIDQKMDIIYKNVCLLKEEQEDLIEIVEKVIVIQLLHKVVLWVISGLSLFSSVLLWLKF